MLAERFRAAVAKSKDPGMYTEGVSDVLYPTGFLSLDFLNGTVKHVKSDNKEFTYNAVGIVDGSATTVIGRYGCGKTTLLIQMAGNIIRPFKSSCIFHDDMEGGSSEERRKQLVGMTKDEYKDRYIYRNSGINTENVYSRIKMIHDLKIENRKEYEYDTGLFDTNGNRIFKLEPTVYILDSIPMLMPKDLAEDDELAAGMDATSIAKKNTGLFKSISQLLKDANIMLFSVNHILDEIVINPMQRKKAALAYLKQGERLTGGKAAVYLANNMFRVDDNAKLKPEEGFGILGAIVDIQILKSRTNKSGRTIPLVLDLDTGFDPILSLFQLLKANNKINGAGSYLYIGDRNDYKFSQKKFKEVLATNVELQKIFSEACKEILVEFLYDPEEEEEISDNNESTKMPDINSMILSM